MTQQLYLAISFTSYWTNSGEQERGSLEIGRIADKGILSANPYELPKGKLLDPKVEKLILNGRDYRPQPRSIPAAVLKGTLSRGKA